MSKSFHFAFRQQRNLLRKSLLVGGGTCLVAVSLIATQSSTLNADKKPKLAPISTRMEEFVKKVQDDMTSALESVEGPSGSKFLKDTWTRSQGGYGCSAVLQDGKVFEKAGVNYSVISSPAPKPMLAQMRARKPMNLDDDKEYDMFVAGVSMVVHPHNPMAPTFHANYRFAK
jgi:coproporphyrinogen III oxidase